MDSKELLANGIGLLASFAVLRLASRWLTGGPGVGTILATGAALAGYVCHSTPGGAVFPAVVCGGADLVNMPGRWVGTSAYRLLTEGRLLGAEGEGGRAYGMATAPWDL